jgi:hypothetical protein
MAMGLGDAGDDPDRRVPLVGLVLDPATQAAADARGRHSRGRRQPSCAGMFIEQQQRNLFKLLIRIKYCTFRSCMLTLLTEAFRPKHTDNILIFFFLRILCALQYSEIMSYQKEQNKIICSNMFFLFAKSLIFIKLKEAINYILF